MGKRFEALHIRGRSFSFRLGCVQLCSTTLYFWYPGAALDFAQRST
jgi:hypothetical protein